MTDREKTFAAAAVLAAAVGVYMEMSYHAKLETEARRREYFPVPSASADSGSRTETRAHAGPRSLAHRPAPPAPPAPPAHEESATPSR